MQTLQVMKFGGSSLANAQRIENVADIIARDKAGQLTVVASAMQGVTDRLVLAFDAASQGGDMKAAKKQLEAIHQQHAEAIDALPLSKSEAKQLQAHIGKLEDALLKDLQAVKGREYSKRLYDRVVSYGERMSVLLLAATLQAKSVQAQPVEATELIVTNDRFGDAEPILDASTKKASAYLRPIMEDGVVPVVTGFIAATVSGELTTLGRGGSDYTSTILGYCLDAHEVVIWTDVTGVMTADPRVISDAKTISELSYEEAAELSFYGAKVLHPLTMLPASQKNIPIYIKNTFDSTAEGTRIISHRLHSTGVVKAVTTLNGLSKITVQGTGTPGASLYLSKIIEALSKENIDILVLLQSSSDHNTMLMVRSYVASEAVDCITKVLVGQTTTSRNEAVHVESDISVVAVVGDGIHATPGLAAEVFSSLAVSGVEALAITYGSSTNNLSFAIKTADAHNAVRSLHQTFQLVAGEAEE